MTSETNRESHDMNINIKSNDSPNFEKETNIIEIPPVDIHDLVKIKHTNNESPANKNLFSQNATNSHPLMYSPTSSPDYPDLIPQKAKCTNYCNHDYDHCKGDSPKTMRNVEVIYDQGFERDYHLYKQVEGVSPSPSLKGMYSIDVRKEPDVIDNDNDNSIYEAHLSSNLQQVSLTMNEKEGNLNFLAHSPHSNKLRLIKVLHTNMSDDSDASSAESITESLRSDDIYLADSKQDCSVGCIDGTHIRIDKPKKNPDDYIDRKGITSIILQGICNENKKFIDVFIGWPGSAHDSRVLKNSLVYTKLGNIQNGYYLLGDSAYPCLKHLIVPYKDNGHLTHSQKQFNKALSSCRVYIEHSFGLLKQRFRQLYYCKLKCLKTLCHFIRACCVLHNLCDSDEDSDLFSYESMTDDNCENNDERGRNEESGKTIRDEVCQQMFLQ